VFLHGTSTGGSVALQLAADHPELVRRLVVVAAAHRLDPRGQRLQAEMARLLRAGQPRQAWASLMTAMFPRPLRPVAGPLSRLTAGAWVAADPTDALVTLDAENAFDLEVDLPRVTAPTLVIGGCHDIFYSPELFTGTAAGVQDGRAHLFPDWGHGRASVSTATTHLTLGFMLAGVHRSTAKTKEVMASTEGSPKFQSTRSAR
jgi:pimeloyl-ACP methyl ester carboxylesterase